MPRSTVVPTPFGQPTAERPRQTEPSDLAVVLVVRRDYVTDAREWYERVDQTLGTGVTVDWPAEVGYALHHVRGLLRLIERIEALT